MRIHPMNLLWALAGLTDAWTSWSDVRTVTMNPHLLPQTLTTSTKDNTRETLQYNLPTRTLIPALILAVTICANVPCYAVDYPQVFTNDYDDPLHPFCRRHIQVIDTRTGTFRYDGTAVGPKEESGILRGCSKEEIKLYKLRTGTFTGTIDANKISAGDGIHEGIWEPAGSVDNSKSNLKYLDVNGIRWNDGNKWIVKPKSVGAQSAELIFRSYLGVTILAGLKGIADIIQRNQKEAS
ncbi:hypothetical protein MPSEU_000099800 [Mayamaea pseudoterrestris]|nr:hypothetical protein MPSEU_000099800 [Mayamaea pseudoterrestris]